MGSIVNPAQYSKVNIQKLGRATRDWEVKVRSGLRHSSVRLPACVLVCQSFQGEGILSPQDLTLE